MSLIGRTEQGEGKAYPPDWLCKRCSRTLAEHVQIGALGEEGGGRAHSNWCFSVKLLKPHNDARKGLQFEPMDNLTYVETIAKKKEELK